MPGVSVSIAGYNRLQNGLRRLASDLDKELDPVVGRWSQETRGKLKSTPYPPKRPGQRYIRTGRLANSWRSRKKKDSQYVIENMAAGPRGKLYATYVVGGPLGNAVREFAQAWMHKGRWWMAKDVIDEELPRLRTAMIQRIVHIWEDRGGRL